jgi:hypothetical protein
LPEAQPEEDFYLKVFDKLLQDEEGYFESGTITKILQKIESRFENRKKRTQI